MNNQTDSQLQADSIKYTYKSKDTQRDLMFMLEKTEALIKEAFESGWKTGHEVAWNAAYEQGYKDSQASNHSLFGTFPSLFNSSPYFLKGDPEAEDTFEDQEAEEQEAEENL